MATVTIVGSDSPSVYLARGKQITVQETDHIRRLIRGGFVNLVGREPEFTRVSGTAEDPELRTESEKRIDDEAQAVRDELGVPKRNASRENWAEFLASGDRAGKFITEDKDRAELIAEWDAYDPDAE